MIFPGLMPTLKLTHFIQYLPTNSHLTFTACGALVQIQYDQNQIQNI